mmetsp:Transcript_50490/g.100795  ORF Transcript_50490/g.100795 Transcript_50490/m.100795 type:complete len:88 (+) Transcript_50490:303-566(+)
MMLVVVGVIVLMLSGCQCGPVSRRRPSRAGCVVSPVTTMGDQGEMGLRTRIGTEGKQVEWAAAQQHDRVAGGRTDDDATVTGVILTA